MITIQAGYAVVVDDEPANRDFVERLLQTASFKVIGASTGAEALAAVRNVPQLALALVDQQLPDTTGLEVIKKLRAEHPDAVLVMATMHDHRSLIDEAFSLGVDIFLVKPHGFMELYRRLKEAELDTTQLRRLVIDQYGPRPYKGPVTPQPVPEPAKDTPPVTPAGAGTPVAPIAVSKPSVPSPAPVPTPPAPLTTPTPSPAAAPAAVTIPAHPVPAVPAASTATPVAQPSPTSASSAPAAADKPAIPQAVPAPMADKPAETPVITKKATGPLEAPAPAPPSEDKDKTLPRRPKGMDAAIKRDDNRKK